MSLFVKKGDTVVVIAGKDRNKTGKVLKTSPEANRVVVEGVAIATKHQKARKQGEESKIVKHEAMINASNVQVICPKCGKATRIASKVVANKNVRVCKKCGEVIEVAAARIVAKKATTKKATAEKTVEKESK